MKAGGLRFSFRSRIVKIPAPIINARWFALPSSLYAALRVMNTILTILPAALMDITELACKLFVVTANRQRSAARSVCAPFDVYAQLVDNGEISGFFGSRAKYPPAGKALA